MLCMREIANQLGPRQMYPHLPTLLVSYQIPLRFASQSLKNILKIDRVYGFRPISRESIEE